MKVFRFYLVWVVGLMLVGCGPSPTPIVITATFAPPDTPSPARTTMVFTEPTLDPTRALPPLAGDTYEVQPGDTLSGIATANNVTMETLIELNGLTDPNLLSVGQVLALPEPPSTYTPPEKVLADARFVRGPGAVGFDVAGFVASQPGYIRTASDTVERGLSNGRRVAETLGAAQVVARVSREFSVDPRLLLALLEYQSGWLSQVDIGEAGRVYPMGNEDERREGLYRQLAWAADQLNRAYYGWRYDELQVLAFASGERVLYHPGLNGASVAVQFFLSQNRSYLAWEGAPADFLRVYGGLFGDPFVDDVAVVPADIEQPVMALPFAGDQTWFYTGGPHGGWGSGSAWAAIDLAPPDEREPGAAACYTSDYAARAVAAGVIARDENGAVVLDLDGDGYEETGWTVLYLHVDTMGGVTAGQQVAVGDVIGYPSCAGGFSNATHLHIARRYNGEWLPADCTDCPTGRTPPPFTLGGWRVYGIAGQEYQGTMVRAGVTMRAEQGRLVTYNRISEG